ncbi:DUF485 domain-containing protein [Stenoxybacter acetivorans]|uniref:DUF485 domain-containing protein n=1 Tax=Stenoxybacter acetivorans TaxID=422441 RepID=UPI00056D80A1|nr:DUF485 domain-containing protein [Stenoxybacter acetivorans]
MEQQLVRRVLSNPEFQRMARKKAILGWSFSVLIFLVYVVYISFMGISPESFGVPVFDDGVTTWGIYLGLFVILFSFVITAIYVHKANGEYETMTQEVVREVSTQIKGEN